VPLANMRSLGRTRVFVYCSNPDCHHSAEIDASGFPDDVTFGDLQPRMLCTVCVIVAPTLARHGCCIMVDGGWKRPFDDPIPLPRGRQFVTLEDAAERVPYGSTARRPPDVSKLHVSNNHLYNC
jgi:hypothetical protein